MDFERGGLSGSPDGHKRIQDKRLHKTEGMEDKRTPAIVVRKQVFHPYHLWEDYKAGMWSKSKDESGDLQRAIEFTSNHIAYGNAMLRVIVEWPITCEHNLTDASQNNRAFIGHCAVMLQIGIPEYIVRQAWAYLTKEQQDLANAAADRAINIWKTWYDANTK